MNEIARCNRCGLDTETVYGQGGHIFMDISSDRDDELDVLCQDCFVDYYITQGYSLDQVEQLFRKIRKSVDLPPGAAAAIMRDLDEIRKRQASRKYLASRFLVLDVAKKPLSLDLAL